MPKQWIFPKYELFGSDSAEVQRDKERVEELTARAEQVQVLVADIERSIAELGGRPDLDALRRAVRTSRQSHGDAVNALARADRDLAILARVQGELSESQEHLWQALLAMSPEEASQSGDAIIAMVDNLGERAQAGDVGAGALLAAWHSYHDQNAQLAVAVGRSFNAVTAAREAIELARADLAQGEEAQALVDTLEQKLLPEVQRTQGAIEAWQREIVQDLHTAIAGLKRKESRLGRKIDSRSEDIGEINRKIEELIAKRTEVESEALALDEEYDELVQERTELEDDLFVNVPAEIRAQLPSDYPAQALTYFQSRVDSPRHLNLTVRGPAYRAGGVFRLKSGGTREWTGWAVDIRVRVRPSAPHRRHGTRTQRFTVVFDGGKPLALRRDARRFRKAD